MSPKSTTTPVRDETLNAASVREKIYAKMRALPPVDGQGHDVAPATPPEPATELLEVVDPAAPAPTMAPNLSQGSSHSGMPAPSRPRTVQELVAQKLGTLPDVDLNGIPN